MGPTPRLADRVALVTGAGGGVGRATCRLLAEEGAAVVAVDIDGEAAALTIDEVRAQGGRGMAVAADVSDESQVRAMVDRAMAVHSRVDILHNNAAVMRTDLPDGDLTELPLEVWERKMAVNARGVMLGCKYGVAAMRRSGRGGSIVNTASVSGLLGVDENASYGASKAAVIGLTRYVASMYGAEGIRCNAVAPGPIVTERLAATLSEHRLAEHAAERLLPWPTTPADVAAVVVFLASDDARCITGQTIVVDGGTTAHRPRHAMQAWDRAMQGRSPSD
ncbi:MAG TPA: SDR family oxidoreductase [Acidimicrobiales bacterium]|nr:SDR family oxidoreductase [Acidimicrobiales bacterium]